MRYILTDPGNFILSADIIRPICYKIHVKTLQVVAKYSRLKKEKKRKDYSRTFKDLFGSLFKNRFLFFKTKNMKNIPRITK